MKIELQVEKLYCAESCQSPGRPSPCCVAGYCLSYCYCLLSSSSNPRSLNQTRKEAAFSAGVAVYKII